MQSRLANRILDRKVTAGIAVGNTLAGLSEMETMTRSHQREQGTAHALITEMAVRESCSGRPDIYVSILEPSLKCTVVAKMGFVLLPTQRRTCLWLPAATSPAARDGIQARALVSPEPGAEHIQSWGLICNGACRLNFQAREKQIRGGHLKNVNQSEASAHQGLQVLFTAICWKARCPG